MRALIDRLIEASNAPRKPAKPPGPILLTLTVVAMIAAVSLSQSWWPSRYGQFARFDPLLVGAATVAILLVVGFVWAIRVLHVVGQDRRWSWWIVAAPIVVGIGALLIVALPRTTMLDHRQEFGAIAVALRETPPDVREDLEIGPFDISSARSTPDGEVYFTEDEGFSLTSSSGWVYAPDGQPSGFDDFTATHLDGPWYEYTAVWRD